MTDLPTLPGGYTIAPVVYVCPWQGVNLNSTSTSARCVHCGGDWLSGHRQSLVPFRALASLLRITREEARRD